MAAPQKSREPITVRGDAPVRDALQRRAEELDSAVSTISSCSPFSPRWLSSPPAAIGRRSRRPVLAMSSL